MGRVQRMVDALKPWYTTVVLLDASRGLDTDTCQHSDSVTVELRVSRASNHYSPF
jgi:hypothetical protein